jgi:hypothetical protein
MRPMRFDWIRREAIWESMYGNSYEVRSMQGVCMVRKEMHGNERINDKIWIWILYISFFFLHTCKEGNAIPIMKLAVQFTVAATAHADGRGPWENISAVMNHGIAPGQNILNPKINNSFHKLSLSSIKHVGSIPYNSYTFQWKATTSKTTWSWKV